MQQPMPQHDQLAAQQMQQQMVLCPVRVVYETQILVQPGDQIQPNQTLFINPQNTPPWATARPVPNQVFYVQQMPGNIMPSIQPHIDQNQLYLHQYPGYQQGVQVIPQQMVQNVQENRNTIQMPNMIHQNLIANFQTNLTSNMNQNMQALPDRTVQQANYGQIHTNVGANMQIQPQTQMNLASNNVISRPNDAMANIQNQQQNQYNAAKVEMKQSYVSQINQAANVGNLGRSQPQVLTVNPMQNLPQTTNVQTFAPIMTNRPIKTESVGSQMTPTYVNSAQNTRIRKVAPTNTVTKITPTIGIRNVGQTQTYRTIQPRPVFRANLPNYTTIEPIMPQGITMQNNPNLININSNLPNTSTNTVNFIRPDDLNRKRKSESPDEIHKKMAAIQVNIAPLKQTDIAKRSTEIGVNTNPIQKNPVTVTPSILQANIQPVYNSMPLLDTNVPFLIQNVQPTNNNQMALSLPSLEPIEIENVNITPQNDGNQNIVVDKDKLIRNTVFTQARGRVLTDKEALVAPSETPLPESVAFLKEITITPKENSNESQNNVKVEINQEATKDSSLMESQNRTQSTIQEVASQPLSNVSIKEEKKIEAIKEERKEPSDMKVSLNTTNNKGMFPMERAVKQEKDFILTHVLDGIVIQESNVAFPIREPLIKRITQTKQQTNEVKDENKARSVEVPAPKESSQTTENRTDKGLAQGDSPFRNLSAETLKSWTVHQLSSHLTSLGGNWEDTASLFIEHEIDGESLYLVSKTQLQNIGVKEELADVICEFVKS